MANNHVTVGVYNNKQYKYNIVRDEDLETHIKYNRTWRPGRIFYVDGKRVWNGTIKEEYLADYDAIAAEVFKSLGDVSRKKPTIPYC